MSEGASPAERLATLTPREREVFDLLCAQAFTNHALALRLGLSQKTIQTHRSKINFKLGVHSTPELLRFALRAGLTVSG